MTSPSSPARHQTGTDKLLVDVADAVAVVTLNNPAKRNALSSDMRAALPVLLEALQADDRVRVVVLTGAADTAFASGADLSDFADRRTSPEARAEYDRAGEALNRSWTVLDKPLIAMIRGFCIGGGLFTALQADIRVAADDSQVGVAAARREETMALAQSIAANAPLTVAACKVAIRAAGHSAGPEDLARAQAMIEACFRSDDYLEGQRAFAEKRPPAFTGR